MHSFYYAAGVFFVEKTVDFVERNVVKYRCIGLRKGLNRNMNETER